MDGDQRERLSRMISYLLRHDTNIRRSRDGFVEISDLLNVMRHEIPWVREEHLGEVIKFDAKGRYEVKNDCIRARYGHSVEVELDLPEADVDILYHGTSPESAKQILAEGLNPVRRQMVHLSTTVVDALKVGERVSETPVVLAIDVRATKDQGIRVLKASEKVYVASRVPPDCIKLLEDNPSD